MLVGLVVWKRFHDGWLQLPFYAVSCILALVCRVAASRVVSRLRPSWLRCFLGLK
jgi:hypothetical protein